MQLAILIVLTLILLVLSPVILSVFIAIAAAVGIVLAWLIAAFAVVFVLIVFWALAKPITKQKLQVIEISDVRKICSGCQVEISASSINCYNCGKHQ